MNEYDPNFKQEKQYAIVGQKLVIYNDEKQILLLKRSDKSDVSERWSFVGGGLDRGEESIPGILREVEEEIGPEVAVDQLDPFYIKTYINKKDEDFVVIIAYSAKFKSGGIVLNWEHTQYEWVDIEEASKMDLTPDARDILVNFQGSDTL